MASGCIEERPRPFIFGDASIVAVIRSADERTANLCYRLLCQEIPKRDIQVISEIPFEKALDRCYEIGITSSAKWLLTVDADVLLRPGSVAQLLQAAEEMPEHYVQLEGRIFDKVFGNYRQAGHRVYRTSLLPLARQNVPAIGDEIRPEFATLRSMGRQGHPSRRVSTVVGIHDFEQYFRDLYRKAFVHATKHAAKLGPVLKRCLTESENDADFKLLLRGIVDGMNSDRRVAIDSRTFASEIDNVLYELNLSEKAPLEPQQEGLVGELLNPIQIENVPEIPVQDLGVPAPKVSLWNKIRRRIASDGPRKASLHYLGQSLVSCGNLMKSDQVHKLPDR